MAPQTYASTILKAGPSTDLWRTPKRSIDTSPSHVLSKGLLSSFKSATTTITITPEALYDQAGLLLRFNNPNFVSEKWIKCGLERFGDGAPRISTVGCDAFADWSLYPVDESLKVAGGQEKGYRVTIVLEREGGAVWTYVVVGGAAKVPLREITWTAEKEDLTEVSVALYAARPKGEGMGELNVGFGESAVEFE